MGDDAQNQLQIAASAVHMRQEVQEGWRRTERMRGEEESGSSGCESANR